MKNRKIINPKWIPKNGGNPLRIEIIEPDDLDLIAKFLNEHFVKNGNLWNSIKITADECYPLSYDAVSFALKGSVSLAAYDDDKLVAVFTNRVHSPDEFSQVFNGQLYHDNPKLEIKEDYAEVIKNGPYNNLQANRIYTFQQFQKQVGKFLPKTTKNLGYFKSTVILPEYQGSGLSRYLGNEGVKLFKQYGCEYIVAVALVEVTYNGAKLKGMKECFEVPYSTYKENGKPVFKDLAERGKSMHVFIGTVDDAMKFVIKTEKEQLEIKKKFESKI